MNDPSPSFERSDRSLAAAALAGAAIMGIAAGMELYSRWTGSSPAEPQPPRVAAASEFIRRPLRPPPAPPPAAPAPAPSRLPAAPAALTAVELKAFLDARKDAPAARRFASEFSATPELREAWRRFEGDGDVAGLSRALRASEAFRRLLERANREPDFQALVAEAAALPGMAEFVRLERKRSP